MKKSNNTRPDIEATGRTTPFSVPEGYFDSFSPRLRERIERDEPATLSLKQRTWQILQPQLALAAAIAAFAILGYFGFRGFMNIHEQGPGNEYIAEYMDFYHTEFSDPWFFSLLESEDFQFDDKPFFESEAGFYDPELYLDYLYNDNINLELIITEL